MACREPMDVDPTDSTPDERVGQELCLAARDNDIRKAKALLRGLKNGKNSDDLVERTKDISSYKIHGKAPLFIAVERGYICLCSLEMVRHLLEDWNADVEQTGQFCFRKRQVTPLWCATEANCLPMVKMLVDHGADVNASSETILAHSKQVTPLWCATEANCLPMVKILVDHGADVNASSETQCTVAMYACHMGNMQIVKYLAENGADLGKPFKDGDTCLMNSVHNPKLCEFLIEQGVDVNAADGAGNPALHVAIRDDKIEAVKLLMSNGANAYLTNNQGDNAFMTAALRGKGDILAHLIEVASPTKIQIATAYELLAAHFIDKDGFESAIGLLRLAISLRESVRQQHPEAPDLSKSNPAYLNMKEARDTVELDRISGNPDAMYMQSLLIRERILGVRHSSTFANLTSRASAYANSQRYQRSVDLWKYALSLQHKTDKQIHEQLFTYALQNIYEIIYEMHERPAANGGANAIQVSDIMDVFEMTVAEIRDWKSKIGAGASAEKEERERQLILSLLLAIVELLLKTPGHDEKKMIQHLAVLIYTCDPRGRNGQSLLHLAVDISSCDSASNDYQYQPFPSLDLIHLLIKAGSDVNAVDDDHNSVMYACAHQLVGTSPDSVELPYDRKVLVESVMNILLHNYGADVCITNKQGMSAYMMLEKNHQRIHFCMFEHVTLKCLAARAVRDSRIEYHDGCHVPRTLVPFIDMH